MSYKFPFNLFEGIALRGLFIIDKEGVIQHSTINNLAIGRSVDETKRTLQVFNKDKSMTGRLYNFKTYPLIFLLFRIALLSSCSLSPSKLIIVTLCPAGFAVCAGQPRWSLPCWMEAWGEIHEARPQAQQRVLLSNIEWDDRVSTIMTQVAYLFKLVRCIRVLFFMYCIFSFPEFWAAVCGNKCVIDGTNLVFFLGMYCCSYV